MIEKEEILKISSRLNLSPDTIEKDYVLGWLLFGISKHLETQNWAFKGGTSLKKCFFETFRFSEDLDFTSKYSDSVSTDILLNSFREIADILYEQVGIIFLKDDFKFKTIAKPNGRITAQGKIAYNGPLRKKRKNATIKIDLTTDEVIVREQERRFVHHPYSDEPKEGIFANCYAFEEVVAEKVRALAQRARPRDVYDVVHFFRNRRLISEPQKVLSILAIKCRYKKIQVPDFSSIERHEKLDEMKAQWENMLAHQLPSLPPLESFWMDIEPFFDWLNDSLQEDKTIQKVAENSAVHRPGRVKGANSIDPVVFKIQFAAANRVCIEFTYNGRKCTVEPLSFLVSSTQEELFCGFEKEDGKINTFKLLQIEEIEITNLPYCEKHLVEISAAGTSAFPPIRKGAPLT